MGLEISQLTIDAYKQVMALWTDIPGMGLSEADSKENISRYLDRNPGMSFLAEKRERSSCLYSGVMIVE